MKIALITITTVALLTANLSADNLKTTTVSQEAAPIAKVHTGWYIGLGVGTSSYSDGDMGKEFDNFSVEVDEGSDTGFKFYGGYKFNTIVGVEASYVQYGTFNYKSADAATSNVSTQVKPKSLNVAANLGYDFLNDQLRPYALVGLGYVNFGQTGAPEVYSTDNGAAFVWGMGVEYTPTMFNGIGFRLSLDNTCPVIIQSYDDPTKDDKAFVNSLRLLSLGVQYKF